MPSLNHYRYLAAVLDRAISSSSSSSSSSLPSTSKMKIGKAPGLLRKAATMFRSKASTVRARLLLVASLRRRMAMVGAISHRIHDALMMVEKEKGGSSHNHHHQEDDGIKALAAPRRAKAAGREKPAAAVHDEMAVVIADHHRLSELALFDQEDRHGYPNWTHELFDDDNGYSYQRNGGDDHDVVHDTLFGAAFDDDNEDDDEPSVIDIIRSSREDEGLEFNLDDEIDHAADMFIRRIRSRMSRSI
ncbi:uncharacterized protein LOC102705659 [Oryza brachyantha]|uniref:Uncharacterized protein n=1 Tax=Oryza brachyantha TaxID=4533 RepID=J3MZ41_ORYBR|nr:uncharacterized protein LOC102705659 [Oryza brachyantha]